MLCSRIEHGLSFRCIAVNHSGLLPAWLNCSASKLKTCSIYDKARKIKIYFLNTKFLSIKQFAQKSTKLRTIITHFVSKYASLQLQATEDRLSFRYDLDLLIFINYFTVWYPILYIIPKKKLHVLRITYHPAKNKQCIIKIDQWLWFNCDIISSYNSSKLHWFVKRSIIDNGEEERLYNSDVLCIDRPSELSEI